MHARDADAEIATILRQERPRAGVLHCFSSGRDLAEAALDLGFYISISGIVTFRKPTICAQCPGRPLDRLLVETDAPYLAPVPYRGKRNEPAYVAVTAAAVAALKGVTRGTRRRGRPIIFSGCFRRRETHRQIQVLHEDNSSRLWGFWGVPAIGPDWGRCDPTDSRNRRRRCSLLVEESRAILLIDTSPDLREQLLDAGVARLDGVLLDPRRMRIIFME